MTGTGRAVRGCLVGVILFLVSWGSEARAWTPIACETGFELGPSDPSILFDYRPSQDCFLPVYPHQLQAKKVYMRWYQLRSRWIWVTGGDRRMILGGSKLQGNRLWLKDKAGLNWYQLESTNHWQWQKKTDHSRPRVVREDSLSTQVISEIAPENWEELGGELDPLDPAPTCSLTAAPTVAMVGETVELRIRTDGKVTSASIEGHSVSFPDGEISVKALAKGMKQAIGRVTGPGGARECRTTYEVKETPTSAPTCTVTASPQLVAVGERVVLRLMSQGTVTSASIDGQSVTYPEGEISVVAKTKGIQDVVARVMGPGGAGECRTRYEVKEPIDPSPHCDITISPNPVSVGQTAIITMTAIGQVTEAIFEGSTVDLPMRRMIVPSSSGEFLASGSVKGPSGFSVCVSKYSVTL